VQKSKALFAQAIRDDLSEARMIRRELLHYGKSLLYDDDDDVYLNKLQTKGVKKSILYMYNVDQPIRHK
jgi:hypothetical protein